MKSFLFLYPTDEYFKNELNRGTPVWINEKILGLCYPKKSYEMTDEELRELKQVYGRSKGLLEKTFREIYRITLNACIDIRYRMEGFGITYALFNDTEISDMIDLHESDRIIRVGMDYKEHSKELPDGNYTYPDSDLILDQLDGTDVLRVAGFHMWDCVEKVAKRAYERGIGTLVDEDLTNFLAYRISLHNDFKIGKYPSYNPRSQGEQMFEIFMEDRRGKPWLWQDY